MKVELDYIKQRYKNKNVLITGHTGFKGAWLSLILQMVGANAIGYALEPKENQLLFKMIDIEKNMISIYGDIRNLDSIKKVFEYYQPEYVFHMAAQPIVRESYLRPVDTYSTNVMGTVNILEAIRCNDCVKSVINVTTDKVYLNTEKNEGYVEDDKLEGYDPYSNSKSCSELITNSFRKSFFQQKNIRISTVRAGNVIGGGDFAMYRIIPDCVRAAIEKKTIVVRNPDSVRPYQHVLEPLFVYLMIASEQLDNDELQGAYNVGPRENDCLRTSELVDYFCQRWGEEIKWKSQKQEGPHEANLLKLNCSKLQENFGWEPKWNVKNAIDRTIEWSKIYRDNIDVLNCMERQIYEYLKR